MSSATTTSGYTAAPVLADVLPPIRQRGRVMTFVRRHPTIVVGGFLLGAMVFIAIFAPYLGTVDPTALAPAKRTREPSEIYWFGTPEGRRCRANLPYSLMMVCPALFPPW